MNWFIQVFAIESDKEVSLQEQVLSAIDSYYALYPDKGIPVYAAQFKTQSAYSIF